MDGLIYQFEDYVLEVAEQRLQKNGEDISLSPKVFGVLVALIEKHGELVTHEELMEAVWKDTFVEDTNLRYCVHSLRKIFDEDFIETVPKRGYRFTSDVQSFTKEEFIKNHVPQHRKDKTKTAHLEHFPPENSETKRSLSIGSPLSIFFVAAVILGSIGIYIFNSSEAESKPETFTSLAIFPFSVVTPGNSKADDFQAGLNDELVFNLQKISSIKVALVENYDELPTKDSEFFSIGKSLGVERLLVGTCRLEESSVKVNFRILNTSDKSAIVTKTITIDRDSFAEIENTIAVQIAREVLKKFIPLRDEQQDIRGIKLDPETRSQYLLSQEITRKDEFSRWHESSNLLRKIVKKYPDWALAKGKLAEALVLIVGKNGCPEAAKFARESVLLDEKTAQAHFVIGYCAQFDWNWELAEKSFVEALKHKPNYSRVYLEYGHILDLQNKKAEAGSVFRKLLELGQFNPFNKASACEHLYFDRKFDEAEKLCIESERLDPGYRIPRYIRHRMYIFRNQPSKILDLKYRHKSASLEENRSHIKALENQNVRRYVQLLLSNPKISMTSMERAALYAHIGDREKAIEHLEKGVKDPFLDFYRLNADPLFESLKHENRFIELLESINIPEENLKDRR